MCFIYGFAQTPWAIQVLLLISLLIGANLAGDDSKAGKFWVYEQAIRIPFYAIYDVQKAAVEVYELIANRYHLIAGNQRGHYPIEPMGVELGIWEGEQYNQTLPWLRWWDSQGNLLLTAEERESEQKQRAERLAAKLRELGIDPEEV